jgi:hypothetical protein
MEMLDRYIEAVGKRLPMKMRGDVATEIRSTIEDMLQDRSEQTGKPADGSMLTEILRSYGSPSQVAAKYRTERYLVGPQLYPIFSLVVRIVFIVLTVLALVGLGIGLGKAATGSSGFGELFVQSLAGYYTTIITAFGNIVLVFWVLQRVLPEREIKATSPESGEWDPQELMKAPSPNELKLWEPIVSILFTFAALVIFNFYPRLLSFTPSLNDLSSGRVVWISIFSQAFWSYLPWLNILWLATIGFDLILLQTHRKTAGTRLIDIALKIMWIGIAVGMLRGPALLNLSEQTLSAFPQALEGLKQLSGFFETLFRIILGVGIFGSVVDIVQNFVGIFRFRYGD